ncbi:SF1B family DNA helicase RecD2 [Desulfovibrio litoralis]|uniref:SF1B family DNA helicase RecD2 n=1 Tax=Desulfovibrio litoralis TaxID=466107 RepID=UPI000934B997|nr:ATP-dependent RecD-like DNA helicase [Desulfovibrio litoralis]
MSVAQLNELKREIEGTLERVVFHNAENGWTVLRLKVANQSELVTAVGAMPDPQPGTGLKLTGSWVNNAQFGRQFQITTFESILPATAQGILHYLGSGLIKGVRTRLASRVVQHFGDKTLDILDNAPERLTEAPGVSPKLAEAIANGWKEHQGVRNLIMFLQPHGVSTTYAVRIYKHYGQSALEVVRDNPYRLAMDLHGIGFITADQIAMKLGFEKDSPLRASAALLYTLNQSADDGHVYYPKRALIALTAKKLDLDPELLDSIIPDLVEEGLIKLETLPSNTLDTSSSDDDDYPDEAIYISRYHHYESKISYYLSRLLNSPKSVSFSDIEKSMDTGLKQVALKLAPEQEEAVRASLNSKVLVITGGPGTGKTTIIKAIIKVFQTVKARILLAAPTGRAAKRMSEATDLEARTIHRLLEYSPKEDGFARNSDNPLACGLLVLDEASMLDTMLMYHLLKAIPLGATVVFVGDVNQLPSVGPGNVLRDLITSKTVKVVELIEIFRQAAESEIICNAHLINHGKMPNISYKLEHQSDFYFFKESNPELVADLIVDLVKKRIPYHFGFNSIEDIQVLTPMNKGIVGAVNLNLRLQEALNPQRILLKRGERQFRLHDKVMQIRNNYDKEVFNGDMGRISSIDLEDKDLVVSFEDRNVLYTFEELDELVPAYAISVHKSQGSEYPVIVLPILTQHYVLLQRNLVYTGVTRGKKLVVLVGEPKAVNIAVSNNNMRKRYTLLAERLRGM